MVRIRSLEKLTHGGPGCTFAKNIVAISKTNIYCRFKMFLEQDKNKTWQDLDTLENFHVSYILTVVA